MGCIPFSILQKRVAKNKNPAEAQDVRTEPLRSDAKGGEK